jgi:hypothetical protein
MTRMEAERYVAVANRNKDGFNYWSKFALDTWLVMRSKGGEHNCIAS